VLVLLVLVLFSLFSLVLLVFLVFLVFVLAFLVFVLVATACVQRTIKVGHPRVLHRSALALWGVEGGVWVVELVGE
jgi:hypothetical protein